MSSSLRRGALAATAIAFSLAALTACGAGNQAATLEVKPDNPETTVGDIKIQNANLVTEPRGTQGPAAVTARIFNNGRTDQVLQSVTVVGNGKAKLSAAKGNGRVVVPAGSSVLLGGKGNPSALVAKGVDSSRDGDAQPVVFRFSETGEIKLTAFVVPAEHYFEEYGPSPSGAASAPASPSGSPSPSGTATASGSPTPTESAASPSESAEHAGH